MTVADVDESAPAGFSVNLVNFEGPFDLLLQLISKHELDITEVALSSVTSEFIAFVQAWTTTSTRPPTSCWSPRRCWI